MRGVLELCALTVLSIGCGTTEDVRTHPPVEPPATTPTAPPAIAAQPAPDRAKPLAPIPAPAPSAATPLEAPSAEPSVAHTGEPDVIADEAWPMERPEGVEAAALFDAADNPCRANEHCGFVVTAPDERASAAGIRWVEVWRNEDEVGGDLDRWRGRAGASVALRLAIVRDDRVHWGPTLLEVRADLAQSVEIVSRDVERLEIGGTSVVHSTVRATVTERCCGGVTSVAWTEHAFCALGTGTNGAPARCAHALERHDTSGEAMGDPGFEVTPAHFEAEIVRADGVVSARTTAGPPPTAWRPPADDGFASHRLVVDTLDLSTL